MADLESENSAKISTHHHWRSRKYDTAPSRQVIASGMNEPILPLTVATHFDVGKSVRVHDTDLSKKKISKFSAISRVTLFLQVLLHMKQLEVDQTLVLLFLHPNSQLQPDVGSLINYVVEWVLRGTSRVEEMDLRIARVWLKPPLESRRQLWCLSPWLSGCDLTESQQAQNMDFLIAGGNNENGSDTMHL